MINGFVHENGFVARIDGILFQFWRDSIPLEGAKAAAAMAAMIVEEGLSPFALYIENAPSTKPPEGEARKILMELGVKSEGCSGMTFVATGGGFMSAASRAVMSSMLTLLRVKYPVEVSKGPEPGLEWLAPIVGVDANTLLSARERMLKAWDVALEIERDPSQPEPARGEPVVEPKSEPTGPATTLREAFGGAARDVAETSADADEQVDAVSSDPGEPEAPAHEPPSDGLAFPRKQRKLPTSLKDAFAPRDR